MRRIVRKSLITKRLQTELQANIAFACYDSDKVHKSGDSANQQKVQTKIFEMYQPVKSSDTDEDIYSDNMSHVKLLLEGEGVYKYLFELEYVNDESQSVASVVSRDNLTS